MKNILDMRINEVYLEEDNNQTFREYIRDLERQVGTTEEYLDNLSNDEVLEYIDNLYVIALIV